MDLKKLEAKKINDLPSMEVGHMLLCKTEESSQIGPVFYIKENINNIRTMLPKITVKFQDIYINCGYSTPLILMIKINDNDDLIYGQWFNKYNKTDRELIKEILFQDKLNFCIVDNYNNCRVRFKCANIYKKSIWEYFKIKENDKRWSQAMFESDVSAIGSCLKSRAELFNM